MERTKLAMPVQTSDGEVTEAVTKITWSGGRIAPGMFEDFDTSMGPLPTDTDQLVFKALQTYDNGEVVRWIEERQEGAPEPEHPAPVLKLTKAVEEGATAARQGTRRTTTREPRSRSASSARCSGWLARCSGYWPCAGDPGRARAEHA